jgi:hypothetical protein
VDKNEKGEGESGREKGGKKEGESATQAEEKIEGGRTRSMVFGVERSDAAQHLVEHRSRRPGINLVAVRLAEKHFRCEVFGGSTAVERCWGQWLAGRRSKWEEAHKEVVVSRRPNPHDELGGVEALREGPSSQ